MKPTILLVGKTGQVGSELHRLLPRLGVVIAPERADLNLLDPNKIRRAVRDIRPKLIVNAAAYTGVDAAEADEVNARAVNADAPALLAEEAKKTGSGLVHFSTDYVFDGSKRIPYDETDPPSPINVYGKTKLAGEQAVSAVGVPHLVFRTAWVYAQYGKNFLLTILRLAAEREELKIVCDQIGAPTCARDIAIATTAILEGLLDQDGNTFVLDKYGGTYHMTAAGETTWYDFATAIVEQAARLSNKVPWFAAATGNRRLVTRRMVPITSAEYPCSARRPAYSVLSNSRLENAFGFGLADWRTQLRQCFA